VNTDIKKALDALNVEYEAAQRTTEKKPSYYTEYCNDEQVCSGILNLIAENDSDLNNNVLCVCETHARCQILFAQIEKLLSKHDTIDVVRIGRLKNTIITQNKHGAMTTIRIINDSPTINLYVCGMSFDAAFVPTSSNSFTKVSVKARMANKRK
jgi:hypothetical protein